MRKTCSLLGAIATLCAAPLAFAAAPLATLNYTVTGQVMQVTPAALSVPKGIAGSIGVSVPGTVPAGAFVEALLRGPSFPARRLVGAPNQPLLLPPLNLVGDYSLDGIRLVSSTGETLLEGTPASVPVQIFDEVLVSRVTSRPLTLEEIQGKGIVIDEQNFRAIEFEVGFVLDGKTIPVKFPVVAPAFRDNTEIIPAAELEARLQQAADINNELSQGVVFPPELETAKLDVQVKGINFQVVDEDDGADLALSIPPIPALMIIPGNIGFLNQFFSVMIFTENGAPAGSSLSATNIAAELVLPLGSDRVGGTFALPGDDPLRFARVGDGAVIQPVQPVRQVGPDGKLGTEDDVPRLAPGETGQGEFLVEGLQEGLHVMDLKLTADLEGLAAGIVKIEGKAAGSVLVRNPKFSFAFAHPRTVRAGEPYDAFVTILNTSQAPANLVNVTLNNNSISGGILESDETVNLGTILPGQTATATFRIRSQRTGAITFSNITTSDDSLIGRFRLHAGVDERGVALSPDTLVLPSFADELPADLLAAANRVLGQALSIAKAGQTPPGVLRVGMAFLKQKAVELAEAGQRVRYGELLSSVLPDLLLDWQGARDFSAGWDQILRETNAGLEWRQALMTAIEKAEPGFATSRLLDSARNFASRGETWFLGAVSAGDFQTAPANASQLNLVKSPTEKATLGTSTVVKALGYPGHVGAWIAGADSAVFEWKFATAIPTPFQASVVLVRADGTASELLWRLDAIAAGACMDYNSTVGGDLLAIDDNCDGVVDRTLAAQRTNFAELPPAVLSVRQEPEVLVGRPQKPCASPETTNEAGEAVSINNYANVLAVLFNKPMTQSLANVPAAYTLDGGNEAAFVQVQPGGRVALLTMRQPVGNLVPRQLSVAPTVTDARGNSLVTAPIVVESRLVEGVTVRGRAIRADGSLSIGVPVTLTYYDEYDAGLSGCLPFVIRSSQVFTNAQGEFQFDFVLAGIPYSISATDTSGLSTELIAAILESTHGDLLDRERLLELANSPSVQNTLLQEFAVGALTQAVAKAEGLDRALVRDLIEFTSPRNGTTAVYALRFRGRGAVAGQVLAADGTTPVFNAAVNLFPDPGSRELGRGIFSDSDGRFAFFGVPLGTFSVEATSPTGAARVISDLIAAPGETRNITVVLSSSAPPLGELQGRVTEPDGTPHAGATVFVGRFDVNTGEFSRIVATASSDNDGYWHATAVTAEVHDLIALSADGKRKGERRNTLTAANAVNTVNLTLQARATVTGRVETSTGIPVENALVGGGEALVRTDSLGRFTLTGVPTGQRGIAAALERNPAAGITFPRTGSGIVNVIPGGDNFVIVRLASAARIIGRVLDETGAPVPNADVAIPQSGGFYWVDADDQGNFEFAGLALGKHDLSSPAPPHEDAFDGEAAAASLVNASQDEILATIGEAFAAFTGVNNPLLNGDGATFNPLQWGFTKDVTLGFDGQTVVADVRFLGTGTIGGIVKNGQGVPIGARVRLTGIGPSRTGAPTTVIRGERNSDPAFGTFDFPDQALVGDWGLQAASPFFPVVISTSGRTTSLAPTDTDNLLQFPAVRETNGSLAGLVLNPDGTAVGPGVKVQISFGQGFIIQTDADGRFATQAGTFTLPATDSQGNPGVGYTVTATDEANGATGRATITVMPSQVNSVTVRLLGRGAAVVTVVRADGSAAAGADLEIQGGAFPNERFEGTSNAAGQVVFQNVFEGPYAASANFGTGLTRLAGRTHLNVSTGTSVNATVILGGTGTVGGTFLSRDGVTPLAFANVALGALAFNSTGADGHFEFGDIPLGTYRLLATDAVTGRTGSANVTLSVTNEIREVNIIETALGEIFGRVINALGNGDVPNAQVSLRHSDPFVPPRTVTTSPDGAFRFPGTPAGALTLDAADPISGGRGIVSATLPETAATFEVNIALAPVANLTVTVFEPDGTTPAAFATVRIGEGNATLAVDTDTQGRARFEALPLATHRVTAESRTNGFTRRWAGAFVPLTSRGAEEALTLTLLGVGSVTGTVFQADGVTAVGGAQVTLRIGDEDITVPGGVMKKPSASLTENVIASAQGLFSFTNVPLGDVGLTVTAQALGASENTTITADGQLVTRNLTLSASGNVAGRIVRGDGTTPATGTDVLITFMSQSGLPGRVNSSTGGDGLFSVGPVPVGAFHAEITNADFGGIARRDASVTANNQTMNLGDIILDEAFPFVAQVTPPNTATGVSTFTPVDLLLSEALAPASVEASGVFIRRTDNGVLVPATLTLTAPPGEGALRLVRLVPAVQLVSEKTYQIVVVDGDLLNATGGITNRGPRDLVGRALAALFSATFTTRDDTAPLLRSFTPANNSEQVDTRSVVRLSFDEPIAPGPLITLTGPGGLVAGTTSLGVNNLVLVFTPAAELPPNATFTASVSGLADVAGNGVISQPLSTTFKSLDTIGPAIATLRIKNNQAPVAGSTVTIETLLAAPEPGVTVRFTADFQPIGTTVAGVFEMPFGLPAGGTVVIRAIASDRFGNQGPVAELSVNVQANTPPVLTLTRLNPSSGSVPTGSAFSARISAADDSGITVLKGAMTGAATAALQTTTGADIILAGVVSSSAGPDSAITVLAEATDSSGLSTGEQTFTIPISDGTPPTLAFEGPAPTGVFVPGVTIDLPVRGRDHFGVTRYTIAATGAFTVNSEVLVNTASKDDARTLSFVVPANAPVTGAAFAITVRAEDAAGRLSIPLSISGLRMVDQTPPVISAFNPVGGSVNVSSLPTLSITFDEPLDPATVTPANVQLFRDADSAVIPVTTVLDVAGRVVTLTPTILPLEPNKTYRLTATSGLTDTSGNALAGSAVSLFTTADFRINAPLANAEFIEGQSLTITTAETFSFISRRVRFSVNNVVDGADDAGAPFERVITVPLLADVPGGSLALRAELLTGIDVVLATSVVNVLVRGLNEDSDGDGLQNGQELAAGSDPFRSDAGEDPDVDGLTNAQEVAAGTKANDSDTDDDFLNDGTEVAATTNPLDPDTDDDLLLDGRESIFSTNPKLADTDGDTLSDGFELGIGRISIIDDTPRTWLAAKADAESRNGHLLTLTSAAENTAFVTLFGASASTSGAWIGHTDRFIEGAFRPVTGEASTFTNFGPGEPNNVGNEDAVQLRSDAARTWNDAPESNVNAASYVLETGFYTNPIVGDTDGDGSRDDVDTFIGPQNAGPVAINDNFFINSGEVRVLSIATDLLTNDSDPDGPPFALFSFTQPPQGSVAQSNATTLTYFPAGGFSGTEQFTYSIVDPHGLTASATVTVNVGPNTRPVAGELLRLGGLSFDGSNDAVSGPALPSITDSFTMEFWVRPTATRNTTGESTGGTSGLSGQRYAIQPRFYAAPESGAGVSVGTNGISVFEHSVDYVPALLVHNVAITNWTHVAVVYNNRTPSLFINGVFVRTGLTSTRAVHPSAEISTSPSFGAFAGSMDELRIWGHARSQGEIANDMARRLSGGTVGLALYWPMDEFDGNSLFDSSPAARTGTLSGGTARIESGVPLTPRGFVISTAKDSQALLVLPGFDADNNALTARILTLPAGGSLFQFSGGVAGAEITSVPANVTDSQRRVVYQPDVGYLGGDGFAFSMFDGGLESEPADALITVVPPFGPVTDDLWDVSRGAAVIGSSGFHPNSAGNNMFGASSGVEPGSAIFADGNPAGFTHFIEWETPSFLRIEGTKLFATQGGDTSGQRTFTEMRLFGRLDETQPFTLMTTFRPGANPYFAPVRAMLSFAPFVAREFRAEFDQFGDFSFPGPRVEELDAIGETVVFVPAEQSVALQNATATFSQGGFNASGTIDGNTNGTSWAIFGSGPDNTSAQTIVWETQADEAAQTGETFTFTLAHTHVGSGHQLGRFRLSATTDSRSTFADGLQSGGDVSATWQALAVESFIASNGAAGTVQGDGSVLVSGATSDTATYTVRVTAISGLVMGFRLEAMEDASLPASGPGRQPSNGNFHLSEVTISHALLKENRAPQAVADSGQTSQSFAVTTGNVLANDTDPEGDSLTVFDFTQPAAGTGSVVNNGNGTFTYTPDPAFNGLTTFTYRATDGHQPSNSATVTVTVTAIPTFTWNNPAGGNWNTASNWTPAHVPAAGEFAKIELSGTYTVTLNVSPTVLAVFFGGASGTQSLDVNGQTLTTTNALVGSGGGRLLMNSGSVNLAGASTVAVFDFGGGTLNGAGNLTVTSSFNWTGGTLLIGGELIIGAGATANLTGSGNKAINRVLRNHGTVNYTGSGLLFNLSQFSNGRIDNDTDGTFIVDGDGDFNHSFQGITSFNNAGAFIKRNPAATFFSISVAFNNSGVVTIEAGTVELQGGGTQSGGTIDAAGGLLMLNGGTYTFNGGGMLNQTMVNAISSTLNFSVNYTLPNLILNNSNIGGAGNVTVTGTLNWISGTLRIGGEFIVGSGATADLTGTGNKGVNRVLRNHGTVNYTGASVLFNLGEFSNGRIENDSDGVFIVDGNGDFGHQFEGASSFNNAGAFIKRNAATTSFSSSVAFNGAGGVTIEAGTLEVQGGGTLSGPITAAGGLLTLTGGIYTVNPGGVLNQASLSITNSTLNVNAAGNFTNVNAVNSTLNSSVNCTLPNLTLNSSNVGGAGNVTVTETFTWISGTLRVGGELIVAKGATANMSGSGNKGINRVLRNHGVINYTGNAVLFNLGEFSNGRIENATDGVFIVDGDGDFNHSFEGVTSFNNAGALIKRNAATTFFSVSVAFNNSGAVTIEAGTVELRGGGTQSGGTIDATAGLFTLNGGTYTFTGGSLLNQTLLNAVSSTLNFTVNYALPNLTLENASIGGAGSVTLSGTFNWISGSLRTGGEFIVASGAIANLTGSGTKGVNRVWRNRGTVNYMGNGLLVNVGEFSNGRIENGIEGLFIVDGDGDFGHQFQGNSFFNNAGAFIKRNPALTTFGSLVPFNNTGTVTIEAGTLELQGGGTQSGTIDATGGLLTLTGGTYTFNGGSLLNQTVLSATSSTLTFTVNYTIPNLTLNASNIGGAGNVTVTETFNWISGTLLGNSGETIVASGATANLTGNATKGADHTLRNRGTVNYTGAGLTLDVNGDFAARIENEPGAIFITDGDGDITTIFGNVSASFNNAGTFIKRAAGLTSFFSTAMRFSNAGTVEIESGTLELRGGGTHSGTINSSAGLLTLTGGSYAFASSHVLNQSALSVTSSALTFNGFGGTLSSISAASSTLTFNVNTTLIGLTLNSSNVGGAGNVTVTNTFDWTSGTLLGNSGEMILANGATANLTGTATKGVDHTLRNRGTINYTGTGLTLDVNGDFAARIENEPGANFLTDGDGDITTNFGNVNAVFNNAGTFIKRGAGLTTFTSGAVIYNNTGILAVESGTLQFQGGFSQTNAAASINLAGGSVSASALTFAAGRITGVGTIAANVTNSGATFAPGNTGTRTIAITGTYNQQAGGRLEFDLDSDAAGGAFDKLSISGATTLNGTVALNNTVALTNEVFPLVSYASRSGVFSTITVTHGGTATATYLATRADFTVTAAEPPGAAPELAASYEDWVTSVDRTWGGGANNGLTASFERPADSGWDIGPMADPDRDGSVNLLEYAFQTNPLDTASVAGVAIGPAIGHPGCLELYCRLRVGATDIEYVMEQSGDLKTWLPLGVGTPGYLSSNTENVSVGLQIHRTFINPSAMHSTFIRVSVRPRTAR